MDSKLYETEPVIRIVDDDESVRKALSRLVESMGMRAEAFACPADLLNLGSTEEADCLLLDVQLPGMDGFELRKRLLEAGHDTPVIFLTAHPDDTSRARARESEAIAYLEKPFEDDALFEAILIALGRVASRDRGPKTPQGG